MKARRAIVAVALGVMGMALTRGARADEAPRVKVLDDGVKVVREETTPLPDGPWGAGEVELFALRGETIALQVVIEAGGAGVADARVEVAPFAREGGGAWLDAEVTRFVERFVPVVRPSGNDRAPGSRAFTEKGAPRAPLVGGVADPLVPEAYEAARAEAHERAAVWIDIDVAAAAVPGTYRGVLLVRGAGRELAARPVDLRVIDAELPYAAAAAFARYDTSALTRRMGDARAERDLRALFHAHRLSAIHELDDHTLGDKRTLDLDRAALRGDAYAEANGYRGPGAGAGEGVLALGVTGALVEAGASEEKTARGLVEALFEGAAGERARGETATFLVAATGACPGDEVATWASRLRADEETRAVRVAVTCGEDPVGQGAGLVVQAPSDYDPARARVAKETRDKWVWVLDGRRPAAGGMVLDVPAIDPRANGWIAARYGVPRWFYGASTAWFDDGPGGHGGERGLDPFVVGETFHDAAGDHGDGDGVLVYPGTQRGAGMTDYGVSEVFPSVRLKNLRRGIEDAGYIALARARDRGRADAVVRRVIPRALAFAGERVAWPEDARAWLEARRELAAIVEAPDGVGDVNGAHVSDGCSIARASVGVASATPWGALFISGLLAFRAASRPRALQRIRHRRNERPPTMATKRAREEAAPPTKPGHRMGQEATARKQASEAPTMPPPAPKNSHMRPKRRDSMRTTKAAPKATVDEVVADLSNDPRREDD